MTKSILKMNGSTTRGDKCDCMVAKTEAVAILNNYCTVFVLNTKSKLTHDFERFFVADNDRFGMPYQNFSHRRRVVGLSVIDKQIIEWASVKSIFYIFQELSAACPVDRIKKDGLLIEQKITVV